MAEPSVIIVPPAMHHKAYRREVYHAYAAFYRRSLNGEIVEAVWAAIGRDHRSAPADRR